jgi:7,8-dihydropterin-6-yl-methyl-4-(beta-D-ribofuranosyl)aminobenzene 5'-phosphate synthase
MKPALAEAFNQEMDAARAAWAAGDTLRTFGFLERAHILGQRHLWPHILTHLWMLRVGLRCRDRREIVGQILRLAATFPGALFGWVPAGNTGGANVSALKPMPIPSEFAHHFAGVSMARAIALRLAVIGLIGLMTIVGVFVVMEWRRADFAETIKKRPPESNGIRVANLGTTRSLEIIPLVNWHAGAADMATEPGVAYLVRTDSATVLFDLGYNARGDIRSPLKKNMERLALSMDQVDAIFISHRHRDHVAGSATERNGKLPTDGSLPDLRGKVLFTPQIVSYPGATTIVVNSARKLFEGMATTGPITRSLFMGPVEEQALVVNVADRGLVVIVGCGHQTVPGLLERLASAFAEPLYGMVGDLHYPVPGGRLRIAGFDAQRLFASGDGPLRPITMSQAQAELKLLDQLQLLALGGHDTSDEVIAWASERFGHRFRPVQVGKPIVVKAP